MDVDAMDVLYGMDMQHCPHSFTTSSQDIPPKLSAYRVQTIEIVVNIGRVRAKKYAIKNRHGVSCW